MVFWSVLLVCATAIHVGFSLSVTLLVYPALARVRDAEFAQAHAAHSRAIVPLVAFVYGVVVVAAAGAVLTTPASVLVWSSALSIVVAVLVTALRAAPLHGRLGRFGHEPALVTSLLRADRVRTLAALLAVVTAVAHALGS